MIAKQRGVTKAAIVTPMLSHFEIPLYRLAAELDGIQLRVFHLHQDGDSFFCSDYQAEINWGENLRSGYPNSAFADVEELQRALFRWAPNVVVQSGYSWSGALALLFNLRSKRVPVVHRGLLTPLLRPERRVVSYAWRKVQPYILRQFQAHHYGGSYSATVLDRARVPNACRYFVPYSVDSRYFAAQADDPAQAQKAQALKRSAGWEPADPVLLFLCQHSWVKGPDVMVQIAAEAQRARPDLKLIMAGSGDKTDEAKRDARSALTPGSFLFPGFIPSKETVRYYLAADLVAYPSRYDTWSRGVNEAMLSRRPCLVSDAVAAAGGLVEHDFNGFVVRGLNPELYARHIVEYLARPQSRRCDMQAHARSRAEYFSYENHAEALRESITHTARYGELY